MAEVAAVQWRFGAPSRMAWLEREAGRARPALRPVVEAVNRTVRVSEPDDARRRRKAAFLAVLLRRAYSLSSWLPPETLLHLERVDIDAKLGTVLITLVTGTKVLDSGDKITVRGPSDDIAVEELAACVARRGWQSVEVTGTPEFRIAASRALLARGIAIVDCPLSDAEQTALKGEGMGFDWGVLIEEVVPVPAPRPPWADG